MLRARAARAPASQQCRRYATAAPASKKKPFERILIANRGEIACRIMRTCKRLGIETIAVYSEPDAGSMHVRKADRAICLGPAVRSYLDMDAVVRAVKESGAQAVHPGYGFLSENPHFAKALEDINVSFLGPSSYSISQMGDKLQAKSIARAAHVSLVPGHESEVKNNDEVMSAARKIGFPVLLKASRGGGGKGQRICWNEQDLLEGFRLCKQEAMNAFGDDRLLIEKFIEHPRHIEIQILGDGQGNTVFLNERECSIQRRNQKVVEEAPSPFLDKATRDKMGKEAVSLANAVKYRSAGTVEFLVDKNKNHYFLEMNTRLQVEHPVTEYITGLDLVEWMIRIGAGEKLPLRQEDVKINGWAMETRVYGEDPLRNFLPSIGLLTAYKEPPLEDGKVRVDTAIAEGSQISIHYDPLIAKLVTWGANRQECTDRMARALDSYVVRVNNTVDHNVNFLRDVLDAPRFRSGALTTSYIPEEYPKGFHGHQLTPAEKDQLVATAAVSDLLNKRRALKISGQVSAPRSPYPSDEELVVSIGEEDVAVRVVEKKPGEATVHINGKPRTLTYNWDLAEPLFRGALDKGEFVIQPIAGTSLRYSFQHVGTKYDVTVQTKRQKELSKHMLPEVKPDFSSVLRSTMPGKIISVAVKPGDTVQPGQELCIVEAMKMQNVLRATKEAKVKAVVLEPGASVTLDQVIIEFEADPAVAAAKAAAAAAAAAKSAAAAKAPAPKK